MKKLFYAAAAALIVGIASVRADMFDRDYALSTSGTGTASRAYVVRGELRGVAIERTGDTAILGGTNMTVTVSSPFHTAFSYAWDGNTDTFKVPMCVADKAADGATTTSTYTSVPLAGLCTVAIAPPTDVAVTNDFKVTLIYWR
jgi:hypothetical protein